MIFKPPSHLLAAAVAAAADDAAAVAVTASVLALCGSLWNIGTASVATVIAGFAAVAGAAFIASVPAAGAVCAAGTAAVLLLLLLLLVVPLGMVVRLLFLLPQLRNCCRPTCWNYSMLLVVGFLREVLRRFRVSVHLKVLARVSEAFAAFRDSLATATVAAADGIDAAANSLLFESSLKAIDDA